MLYWLESSHKDYEDIEITTYLTLEDALVEYNATIQEMMKVLPKSEWFNLALMRRVKLEILCQVETKLYDRGYTEVISD